MICQLNYYKKHSQLYAVEMIAVHTMQQALQFLIIPI
jgi:hypothetical protein